MISHIFQVSGFMDISDAYIYNNGSVLVTQYAKYGTLITNINTFKAKAVTIMFLVTFFYLEKQKNTIKKTDKRLT